MADEMKQDDLKAEINQSEKTSIEEQKDNINKIKETDKSHKNNMFTAVGTNEIILLKDFVNLEISRIRRVTNVLVVLFVILLASTGYLVYYNFSDANNLQIVTIDSKKIASDLYQNYKDKNAQELQKRIIELEDIVKNSKKIVFEKDIVLNGDKYDKTEYLLQGKKIDQ